MHLETCFYAVIQNLFKSDRLVKNLLDKCFVLGQSIILLDHIRVFGPSYDSV